LETDKGNKYTYNYLVVCPGVSLRWDKIDGAKEALDDPNSPVGSIYRLDYAYKTSKLRENFKGGKAIFTLPTMPIKCGGAPQKIMYLSEETFRKNGVRDRAEISYFTSVGNMFPNCLKYADKLNEIKDQKGINVNYFKVIQKVDKNERKAYFKDAKTGEITSTDYDFLHLVPP
jgi:NADPH-dependent 2,4-dienoyl-CoA reductase/sulfur reductase-like enzyme